jgi:AraC-like DNA-binding protein
MEVIFLSGIFMSLFIVLLLMTKKPKALPDRILIGWIIVIALHLLGYYLKEIGYWEKYPHIIGVTAPVPLFHGPFLYLYCLYVLRGEHKIRSLDYLHFTPGILSYIYLMDFFFTYTPAQKILLDKGEINEYELFSTILLMAILVSGVSYPLLSYRLTIKHKQKIVNQYSFQKGISLKWMRHSIISIGAVFFTAIIVFVLRDSLDMKFPFNPEYIFYTLLILFIFYIGYSGIKHENIFTNISASQENFHTQTASNKYKNSGLSKEQAAELLMKLKKLMEKEKPHLQPKLTLTELAEKMQISNNQLSQVINQEAKVNFHDFINTYRVEEFLQKASENKNFNLLAIALESGFNSKSSFNTIFKKQKGVSPSQFLARSNN